MIQKIKNYYNKPLIKELLNLENAGLYAFLIIVIALTWSAVGVVQSNYKLESQITKNNQEIYLQELTNQNQKLKNQYYKSNEYLELAARKQLGKVEPGEKVIAIPRDIALKNIVPVPSSTTVQTTSFPEDRNTIQKNLQDWLDYFTHRLGE